MKGEDELILMTKAAVKTSFLNKSIREKDREIAVLSYKKATVGDLIAHLINESRDQLFQISGMNESILEDTDDYKEQNRIIKNATDKIYELYDALNFENEKTMNIKQFVLTVKELLKAKLLVTNTKLQINCDNDTLIINNYANEVIYLVLKTIDILVKEDVKETIMDIKENNGKIELKMQDENNCLNVSELKEFINNNEIKIKKEEKSILFQL